MEPKRNIRISFSPQVFIGASLTLVGLVALYAIRDIIVLFLVVVAIVVALLPIIKSWERRMPRVWAIVLLYALLILGLVALFSIFLPPVVSQVNDFLGFLDRQFMGGANGAASIFEQLRQTLSTLIRSDGQGLFSQLLTQFQGSLNVVYSGAVNVFNILIAIITVFVTSFYLLVEEKGFYSFLGTFLPDPKLRKTKEVLDKISDKMGSWLRGQLLLMISVGILNGVALALIGVPYALLLGLWSGVMEFLPYVGPILGAIPGVFLAFATMGVTEGLIVIAAYFVVQLLENNFLVPKIMGKALGLSPVVIIFALLIGGKLLGFVGLLIAVPIAAVLSVFFEEWRNQESKA